MANEVFANNLEIACKAADGKSVACFPDVCFTPPSPPAGWIPIPYANTAYAKDTANASKTVFISGKPVMKKDVSYFKTSTGNEPAAGPQGIMTHVKKGKAYFASWSMNVKIEGQNVDRHTDMTTHNHGSIGNTAPWFYADKSIVGSKCKTTRNETGRKCKKPDDTTNSNKKKKSTTKNNTKGGEKDHAKDWKKHYCGAVDKAGAEYKSKKEKLNEKKELADSSNKRSKANTAAKTEVKNSKERISKKRIETRARSSSRTGLGRFGGSVDSIAEIMRLRSEMKEEERLKRDEKEMDAKDKVLEQEEKILNKEKEELGSEIKELEKEENEAENKFVKAAKNKCLTARKCILFRCGNVRAACCEGQTPHHVIPNAMIQEEGTRKLKIPDKEKNIKDCEEYNEHEPPCVCVEGASQHDGSHKIIHINTTHFMSVVVKDAEVSLDHAKKSAIKAHTKSFHGSGCKEPCLRAQLNAYYDSKGIKSKKICKKNARLRGVDANGHPLKKTGIASIESNVSTRSSV